MAEVRDPKTGQTFEEAQQTLSEWTAPIGAYSSPTQTTTTQTQSIPIMQTSITPPPLYEPPPPPDDLSIKAQLDQNRKAVEEAYQTQLNQINKQLEEAQKREAEFKSQAETTLKGAEQLTSPFREGIEKAERERLKVEENFFANQALTNELDKLLSESIEMTRKLQTQKVPGLAGLQQSERMIKAQQNVQGRIAVIEAVMAARNNQIGVANTLIDRTLGAIQADRQDRLNYLSNLFNWYETQRTEEGKKIFNLTQDQKGIINSQIGLLENDLAQAERSAQLIKDIMLEDPKMASESGISLSDTEQEIATKIANWQYNTEVSEMKNKAEEQGLKFLTPDEAARYSSDRIFTQIDSQGVERQFLLPEAQADWDLRTIGGSLYRVDAQTGARELLIGGGTTGTGTSTGTDREYARKLAKDEIERNPNATDAQLYSMIRDKIKGLNITDVNKEIANARTETGTSPADMRKPTATVIGRVRSLVGADASLEDIQNYIELSGYNINHPEIQEILKDYTPKEKEKGWWEKFVEWGKGNMIKDFFDKRK